MDTLPGAGEPAQPTGSEPGEPSADTPVKAQLQFKEGANGPELTATVDDGDASSGGEPSQQSNPPPALVGDREKIRTKHIPANVQHIMNLMNEGLSEEEAARRAFPTLAQQAQPPQEEEQQQYVPEPDYEPFDKAADDVAAQIAELDKQREEANDNADFPTAQKLTDKRTELVIQQDRIATQRSDHEAQIEYQRQQQQAALNWQREQQVTAEQNQVAQKMVSIYPDMANPGSAIARKVEEKRNALMARNSPALQDPAILETLVQAAAAEVGAQAPTQQYQQQMTQPQSNQSPFAAYQQQAPPPQQYQQPAQPYPGSTGAAPGPQSPEDLIKMIGSGKMKVSAEQEAELLDRAMDHYGFSSIQTS